MWFTTALKQLLNRRFWRNYTFASWHQRCYCQGCDDVTYTSLGGKHLANKCLFPSNGERYKLEDDLMPYAVHSYCTACALNKDGIFLDRTYGKGHGRPHWLKLQREAYGKDGVFV